VALALFRVRQNSMAKAPKSPVVLSLEDPGAVPARLVQIGSKRYRIRSDADFTLAEGLRFQRLITKFGAVHLSDKEDWTDEEAAALSRLVLELALMATDAPREVIERLHEHQRCALVVTAFFSGLPGVGAAKTSEAIQPPKTKRRSTRFSRG
jgi:hypothetical protein